MNEKQDHIEHLEKEITILESLIQPSGSGSLYTTIDILKWRIEKEKELIVDSWRGAN